ncbi:hypothetical protein Arub01_21810 [Actinomadura rubrobrunea]|uniref:Uncharacterized protein n=1 Tax=Actinomadura rubrobrunea TaxID=115335 RepID=A0A9W6PUN3_9ACTN|nr:hypothetical protein [Actinomadura rubrobrunea]GLW63937.1 hypothetical protein Arub01_21810 [Actinomadura rubrobrunea]
MPTLRPLCVLTAALVAPLLPAATGVAPARPAAAAVSVPSRPPVVPVEVTADGFCAPGPDPRPPGLVTFRVTTPDPSGHWWALLRLRDGVTLEQVNQEFADSYSPDPAVALPALRAIYRDVDFRGGVSVTPAGPVSVTSHFEPGTYYMSDTALEGATDGCGTGLTHLQRFRVAGEPRHARPPKVNTVVEAQATDSGQRFVMPGTWPRKASVLLRNRARQPHEVIIVRVVPGTTDADVARYFDALQNGDTSVPDPFRETVGGMLAVSPGREGIFQIDLPPGRYAVLSFVRNPQTGVKSAFEGMFKTVTVR